MDLLTVSENLAQFSKQLSILQDYITIKFGVDFQEFYKSRSQEQNPRILAESPPLPLNPVATPNTTTATNDHYPQPNSSRSSVPRSQRATTSSVSVTGPASSSSMYPEVLQLVNVKTEDDFFDEMEECGDSNYNLPNDEGNDPLQRFDMGTLPEDPSSSTEVSGAEATCYLSPKRKRTKNKIVAVPPKALDPSRDGSQRQILNMEPLINPLQLSTTRTKKSAVWDYFCELPDTTRTKCLLCEVTLSRGGVGKGKKPTTGTMRNHLKHKHPEEFSTMTTKEKYRELHYAKCEQLWQSLDQDKKLASV